MPTELSVNLNAVAQLRNRRDLPWPSVLHIARIVLDAGAIGVTVHPRPDQRHIRFSDVPELKALLGNEFADREFNIEGYPTPHFLELVEASLPEQVTLVPDDPDQATSDHGWQFETQQNYLAPIVERLKSKGMRVALFADANPSHMALAKATGCDRVELYTGPYGSTHSDPAAAAMEIERLKQTAMAARDVGLELNAGHDLTVANLPALISAIPFISEVSIGHALTADALLHGFEQSTLRYRKACGQDID